MLSVFLISLLPAPNIPGKVVRDATSMDPMCVENSDMKTGGKLKPQTIIFRGGDDERIST
jgi:hypothetical protein